MGEPRELLPNTTLPTPALEPAPAPGARRIVCDYCKCQLAADGTVLKGSDRVREIHTHETTIETLTRGVAERDTTIATLTTERDRAVADLRALQNDREARRKAGPFS